MLEARNDEISPAPSAYILKTKTVVIRADTLTGLVLLVGSHALRYAANELVYFGVNRALQAVRELISGATKPRR